ncbi:MAG: helix-turn-helix domain-containing protein [Lachnospiraceae bacterium]|nr:helix-turn-helix domain-containing protein [Lachnospiraceae bacterium]
MEYPSLDVQATGERIRSLRVDRHLRVEDIALFMGFESPNAVYKWQRGECLPTVDNLYALSRLFETTVDDILIPTKGEDESLPLHFFMIL